MIHLVCQHRLKTDSLAMCGLWWSSQHLTAERRRRWAIEDASGIWTGRCGIRS